MDRCSTNLLPSIEYFVQSVFLLRCGSGGSDSVENIIAFQDTDYNSGGDLPFRPENAKIISVSQAFENGFEGSQ